MSDHELRELQKLVAAKDTVIAAQAEKIAALERLVEIDRELHRGRVNEGLARVRVEGKKLGRPRRLTREDVDLVVMLKKDGKSWREISKSLGAPASTIRAAFAKRTR